MTNKERRERNARIKGYFAEVMDSDILSDEELAEILRICITAGQRKYAEYSEEELMLRFGMDTHPGSESRGDA